MMALTYTFSESTVVVGVLAMGLMAIGVVIFVLIYQKKFVRQRLAYQQTLLEASLASQERERERVAEELHDGIGAMLAAAKLLVHRLPSDGGRPEIIQDIKDTLAQTIQEVRTISQGLSPLAVQRLGCAEALRNYCKLLNEAGSVSIRFTFDNIEKSNNFKAELSLYRIAQELIHNAIQHAHLSQLQVSLTAQSPVVRLEVNSDGPLFDLRAAQSQGLGLLDVQSRLETLQGTLYQRTLSDSTHSLIVEIPFTSYNKPR